MTNILIIEDEPAIAALLTLHLRELPSQVAICNQGWQGLDEAVKGRYDFLILDVMLPGLNGLEICRRLRQQLPFLPILMLTSCSDDQDKIAGLELGADDYVTKPFHAGELLARVRSILRRTRGERRRLEQQADYLERGELQMDVPLRCVRKRGLKIDLTVREFDLLQLFMQHPGRPFSRPEILDAVWGEQFEGLEHTVNSHINRLRSKIEDDLVQPHYILTVGYRVSIQRRGIMATGSAGIQPSSRFRLRLVLFIVLGVYLLLTAYFLVFGYVRALAAAEKASLMRLNGIVYTLSMQIDGDRHQRLMDRFREKDAIRFVEQDSDYLAIHQVLRRSWASNMLNTPIYTIVLDSANTCAFGVTSAEKPYFRHWYHSAPALLMEKHTEGAMIPRYRDEFGTWLSAFSGIRNSTGELVALVQADQRFDDFLEEARADVWRQVAISMLVSAALLVLLMRLLQPILKKEQANNTALDQANQEIRRINDQLQQNLEQITQIDTFRKEMIANLSHDLRTPLASMLGYLETACLQKEPWRAADRENLLEVALGEARRLQHLISDLFELSKLESGQIIIHPEPFNIAELAQDVLQKYRLHAREKQVELRTDFNLTVPLVLADLRWTDRVLQNLLDNALRFVDAGGFIQFTIFEKSDKIHFKVCNSGDPIPEAQLSHVFDRYFKGSNRKTDSTGLGLAIVKKIIELHRECIWVESTDQVTTFRFTLPVYRPNLATGISA